MTNHGGKREGAGRKPIDPKSKTVIVPVTITENQRDYLRKRGDGNVSKGVRDVVDTVRNCLRCDTVMPD